MSAHVGSDDHACVSPGRTMLLCGSRYISVRWAWLWAWFWAWGGIMIATSLLITPGSRKLRAQSHDLSPQLVMIDVQREGGVSYDTGYDDVGHNTGYSEMSLGGTTNNLDHKQISLWLSERGWEPLEFSEIGGSGDSGQMWTLQDQGRMLASSGLVGALQVAPRVGRSASVGLAVVGGGLRSTALVSSRTTNPSLWRSLWRLVRSRVTIPLAALAPILVGTRLWNTRAGRGDMMGDRFYSVDPRNHTFIGDISISSATSEELDLESLSSSLTQQSHDETLSETQVSARSEKAHSGIYFENDHHTELKGTRRLEKEVQDLGKALETSEEEERLISRVLNFRLKIYALKNRMAVSQIPDRIVNMMEQEIRLNYIDELSEITQERGLHLYEHYVQNDLIENATQATQSQQKPQTSEPSSEQWRRYLRWLASACGTAFVCLLFL